MRSLIAVLKSRFFPNKDFSSNKYWSRRYESGGNSGMGSYGCLAGFKASVLNDFVKQNGIASILEFGCGDGNQLTLAQYPKYTGYDISSIAVEHCRKLFKTDASKEFFLAQDYDGRLAELVISLDVIFHLTEDEIFDSYMRQLFTASSKHVVIYASNHDEPINPVVPHVRHRNFSKWIDQEVSAHAQWRLIERIPNLYPYNGDVRKTSFSDFYIYERA